MKTNWSMRFFLLGCIFIGYIFIGCTSTESNVASFSRDTQMGDKVVKFTEFDDYRCFTKEREIDKAFNLLEGILKGINIDNEISQIEIEKLRDWCGEYYTYINRSPFSEVIKSFNFVLKDNIVTKEEYDYLVWVSNNMRTSNRYYDAITADLQRLQGILHGILSDNIITKDELDGLKNWIENHPNRIGSYPYDAIEDLLSAILKDGKITDQEQDLLQGLLKVYSNFPT